MASYCSPRRPGEPLGDYWDRSFAALHAWRRQFVDDYYNRRQSRLISPNSDDLREEDLEKAVRDVERDILIDSGQARREDFMRPREEPPRGVYLPGKSLSEISGSLPQGLDEFPDEWLVDDKPPQPRRSPTPEIPARRRRSTPGHKRKRGADDDHDHDEPTQPGTKRSRRNIRDIQKKRKRVSDDEGAGDGEEPAKRRKRVKFDLEITADDIEEPARIRPDKLGSSSARVTRARRPQLSGLNAQLFQLGQRGQLSLQGDEKHIREQPEAASRPPALGAPTERATGRPANIKKPSEPNTTEQPTGRPAGTRKPSRPTTNNTAGTKAKTTTASTRTRASGSTPSTSTAETEASIKISIKPKTKDTSGAVVKARRGRPGRQASARRSRT